MKTMQIDEQWQPLGRTSTRAQSRQLKVAGGNRSLVPGCSFRQAIILLLCKPVEHF